MGAETGDGRVLRRKDGEAFLDFTLMTSAERLSYLDGWARARLGLVPPGRVHHANDNRARNMGAVEAHAFEALKKGSN